jgi:hypothetical protein
MFRTVGKHVPPPAGLTPPVAWGDESRLRELFGDRVDLTVSRQAFPWRWPSARAYAEYFEQWYGPTVAAAKAVGAEGREALIADLASAFEAHNTANRRHLRSRRLLPAGRRGQALTLSPAAAYVHRGPGRGQPLLQADSNQPRSPFITGADRRA